MTQVLTRREGEGEGGGRKAARLFFYLTSFFYLKVSYIVVMNKDSKLTE